MEEKTADEIAVIFSAAGDSVTLINTDANYAAFVTRTASVETEDDWKNVKILNCFDRFQGEDVFQLKRNRLILFFPHGTA